MIRIAVLDDFQDAARPYKEWQRLEGKAAVTFFTDNVTGDALVERLLPFDVVVAIRERSVLHKPVLDRLPNLKLIATVGMRNAGIDGAACRARGIPVTGTESPGAPTAELAFALILALSRNLVAEDASLRAGTWETKRIGRVVRGQTLGLVGAGKLGAEVGRMARAFGMEVIAWSPNLTPERAEAAGVRAVSKEVLFSTADYISVHLVLSDRSRGVVGAEDIGRMQRHACLVNTSRAPLVDGAALVAALTEGRIGGAGLDVFETEPVPADAPILSAPNTILTPHLGYAVRESYDGYFPGVVECIESWMAGAPVRVLNA